MRLLVFVGGLLVLAAAFLTINQVTAPSLNQYAARTSVAAERDCGKEPGFLGGPFVASAETAQRIFEAVALGLRGPEFTAKYTINVSEETASWAVYQSLHPEPDGCQNSTIENCVTVTSGGGGLSMRIDKCTGAISQVHYQR